MIAVSDYYRTNIIGNRAIKTKTHYPCKRLLAVDDEANMKIMYKKVLSRNGFKVDTVSSASEALDLIRTVKYDLLLIDIQMIPIDGLELLAKLRQIEPDVPVIMITGYPSVYTARRSRELGAFDFLTKPIEINKLKSSIERALDSTHPGD